MTDEKNSLQNDEAPPVTETNSDQGKTKQVDTKVQEDAALEREKTGGYQ